MNNIRIGIGPFFEHGIEGISYEGHGEVQGLPDQQQLTPADHAQRSQLETLLAPSNTDSFLAEKIRPELQDRDLLLPGRFRQAMDGALGKLGKTAQEQQAQDPDTAKLLNRAARVVQEEVSLRDLVQMYITALRQG
jgi:type III secretion protein X